MFYLQAIIFLEAGKRAVPLGQAAEEVLQGG